MRFLCHFLTKYRLAYGFCLGFLYFFGISVDVFGEVSVALVETVGVKSKVFVTILFELLGHLLVIELAWVRAAFLIPFCLAIHLAVALRTSNLPTSQVSSVFF